MHPCCSKARTVPTDAPPASAPRPPHTPRRISGRRQPRPLPPCESDRTRRTQNDALDEEERRTMAIEFSHEANQSPASAERREEILKNPGFGDYFTDHMSPSTGRVTTRPAAPGTTPESTPTARSSSTPQHPSSTTVRKSSRASRATATPTAPYGPSAPKRTRHVSRTPHAASPCPSCPPRPSSSPCASSSKPMRHGFPPVTARPSTSAPS